MAMKNQWILKGAVCGFMIFIFTEILPRLYSRWLVQRIPWNKEEVPNFFYVIASIRAVLKLCHPFTAAYHALFEKWHWMWLRPVDSANFYRALDLGGWVGMALLISFVLRGEKT